MSALERRYRRLLALYPREHRAVYEEEMLGVLLAAARPGRRRPGMRDTLDVVRGALLIRLRRFARAVGRDWPDALAIVSLLAPILLCLGLSVPAAGYMLRAYLDHSPGWSVYVVSAIAMLAWPTVLVIALAGLRRTARVAAWAVAALGLLALAGEGQEWAGLGLLAAAALTWSPGPARGIALLGRARVIAYLAGVALLCAFFVSWAAEGLSPDWTDRPALVALLVGLLLVGRAAFRFDTPTARRASVLLALPLTTIGMSLLGMGLGTVASLSQRAQTIAQAAVPVAVFLGLALFSRRARSSREAL